MGTNRETDISYFYICSVFTLTVLVFIRSDDQSDDVLHNFSAWPLRRAFAIAAGIAEILIFFNFFPGEPLHHSSSWKKDRLFFFSVGCATTPFCPYSAFPRTHTQHSLSLSLFLFSSSLPNSQSPPSVPCCLCDSLS